MQGGELLQVHKSLLCLMAANGLSVQDVELLRPYAEYIEIMAQGNKKMYAEAVMMERYHMGRTAIKTMLLKMEQEIKM